MISVLVEQALSLTPVLPVYGRLRQEDHSESWGQAKRFSNTLSKNNGWRGGGGSYVDRAQKTGHGGTLLSPQHSGSDEGNRVLDSQLFLVP